MADDFALLQAYLVSGDQEAFRALVDAHLPMVYSLARREFAGHDTHAEDIAQSVFVLLAQKGRNISRRKPLAAWLYQTTRYCCANLRRMEARRIRHETEAAMQASNVYETRAPDLDVKDLLNEALAQLSPKERDLLLIRYSAPGGGSSVSQIAAALGVSPDAAEKRVERAIGKLRAHFARRKQLAHTSAIPTMLALQTGTTPQHLAAVITKAATNAGPASPGAVALVAAFAKSSTLHLKAATILLVASAALAAIGLTSWHFMGAVPVSAAAPVPSTMPEADALPELIPGPLPQETYFADSSRDVFAAGNFAGLTEKGMPQDWSASVDPFAAGNAIGYPKRPLIRITSASLGQKIEMRAVLPLKAEWRKVAVRATIGVEHLQLGDSANSVAGVIYYPVDEKNVQVGPGVLLDIGTLPAPFMKIRIATLDIPARAAKLAVVIRLSDATGVLNVERLGVTPVDEKKDADPSAVVALQAAVKSGNVNRVVEMITADKRLLECRNMQWACGTPLLGATWAGKDEVLSALIKLGSDVKACEDSGDNVEGYWTAEMSACYRGRYNCLKVLLDVSPEDPKKLMNMIKLGMQQHRQSGSPADYQQCIDVLEKKFPGVEAETPSSQSAP